MINDKTKNSEVPAVIIKPLAYYKMLVHVLRFGSNQLKQRQFNEVMGVLIGRLNEENGGRKIKQVIVEDAIPVSHGGAIEVRFSAEQLGDFGEIDNYLWEKYGDNLQWFSLGWYHSHPNLGIFFSQTDIHNQLFWQEKNPSGIGIVFDHTYLNKENDYGFRVFRLDEPSKGQASGYHEVEAIVEPPQSLKFYTKIIDLINSVHTKHAPILERNEKLDIFRNVLIPKKEFLTIKAPEINSNAIISSLKVGILSLIEGIIKNLIDFVNEWGHKLQTTMTELNFTLRDTLESFTDEINEEVDNIQKLIKQGLSKELDTENSFVYQKIEAFMRQINTIVTKIDDFNKQTIEYIEISLTQNIKENYTKALHRFNKIKERIENIDNLGSNIEEEINYFKSGLEESKESIKDSYNHILTGITNQYTTFDKKEQEQLEISHKNSIDLVNQFNEVDTKMHASLSTLEELVNSLKSRIQSFERNNEDLQNELNKAKEENSNLQKEMDEIKKERKKLGKQIQKANNAKNELEIKMTHMKEKNEKLKKQLKKSEEEKNQLLKKINKLQPKGE
ncbi:MAG: hypothetical protein BAJALOKI1v1_240024 [Promethearchaeota archaeon]|nr:MAG: hypothetical protein BAJALOKI1v1_240024 [Candidatus Lokiarchaeota archaeon]